MQRNIAGLLVLVGALFAACGQNDATPVQPGDDVVNHTGTVQSMGTLGYAIVDDRPDQERFAPSNLPERFQRNGERVQFSGKRNPIPPSARLWGTPLQLSSIRTDRR